MPVSTAGRKPAGSWSSIGAPMTRERPLTPQNVLKKRRQGDSRSSPSPGTCRARRLETNPPPRRCSSSAARLLRPTRNGVRPTSRREPTPFTYPKRSAAWFTARRSRRSWPVPALPGTSDACRIARRPFRVSPGLRPTRGRIGSSFRRPRARSAAAPSPIPARCRSI